MTSAAASPNAGPYVVTLEQVGSDVVATGSGKIDLRGLQVIGGGGGAHASIGPSYAAIFTGVSQNPSPEEYGNPTSFTGPISFGSGDNTYANIGSGDGVGIVVTGASSGPVIYLPVPYASDTPLSDSATATR
jgi:hypothetical protein